MSTHIHPFQSPGELIARRAKGTDFLVPEEVATYPALEMAEIVRSRSATEMTNLDAGLNAVYEPVSPGGIVLPMAGGHIAPLFDVVPNETGWVYAPEEIAGERNVAAAATAYGTALPQSSYGFTKKVEVKKRIGAWISLDKDVLSDPGLVNAAVRLLVSADVRRALDAEVLSGDGTGEHLLGFLDASVGVPVLARGTATRLDAILAAAAAVREDGYIGPIVVAATPADLLALLQDKDTAEQATFRRELLEPLGIRGFVASSQLTAGTVVVGSFAEAGSLYVGSLAIMASTNHEDYFLLSLVALSAEMRAFLHVPRPGALRVVTGFSDA